MSQPINGMWTRSCKAKVDAFANYSKIICLKNPGEGEEI